MDRPKAKDEELIDKFFKLLQKKGQLKDARRIIELAEGYYLEKKGNKKITLETARKLSSKDFLKDFKKEGDIVEEKINSDLVAGIKVIVNKNNQLDFSLQKSLNEVFK